MISDSLQKTINKLNKRRDEMFFYDGATDDQISDFEKANNITLPAQFKEWLSYSDGGECYIPAGVQFYGVAHKPIIDVNCDNRPNENYIVIGTFPTGDPVLCEKNKNSISIFNLEDGRIEEDEVFPDFSRFLDALEELLGVDDET